MKEMAHNADQKARQGKDYDAEIKALRAQKAQLEALEGDIRDDFAATGKYLKDKKLPAIILDRQNAAVKEFEAKHAALKTQLDALENPTRQGTKRSASRQPLIWPTSLIKIRKYRHTHGRSE